jgi:hypothetical protein
VTSIVARLNTKMDLLHSLVFSTYGCLDKWRKSQKVFTFTPKCTAYLVNTLEMVFSCIHGTKTLVFKMERNTAFILTVIDDYVYFEERKRKL